MTQLASRFATFSLALLLAGYGVLGYYAPYIFLVVSTIGLVLAAISKSIGAIHLDEIDWVFLIAFGVLGIPLILNAQTPRDILSWGNFAWFPSLPMLRASCGKNRPFHPGG